MNPELDRERCGWAGADPANISYHDYEWGMPVHDEARLFELLTLEGAQSGLSWLTILHKREGYRKNFAGFDPRRVAGFDRRRIELLVSDPAIVRHRGKIEATVNNARRILALWESGQTLDSLAWSFVDGEPVQNRWRSMHEVPSSTAASLAMSKAFKKLGFRFVGATTCYAFMQAGGLVNDHLVSCPEHRKCRNLRTHPNHSGG